MIDNNEPCRDWKEVKKIKNAQAAREKLEMYEKEQLYSEALLARNMGYNIHDHNASETSGGTLKQDENGFLIPDPIEGDKHKLMIHQIGDKYPVPPAMRNVIEKKTGDF